MRNKIVLLFIVIGILSVLFISGCEIKEGSKCETNEDCNKLNCSDSGMCTQSLSPDCYEYAPVCINKTCKCVLHEVNNSQMCQQSSGIWRQFGDSCADTCVFARNPEVGCLDVLTMSCDCGNNKCWNGVSCEFYTD